MAEESWQVKLDKFLHEKNKMTEILEKVEKASGVKRLYIAYGVMAFMGLYLMVGYGADFICNLIGFVYPAYCSIKAIESKEKDDDTKWLTYWVVYASFMLVEFFADIFLFWIPLYWFLKCCFLIYCMIPGPFNGSIKIYHSVIRPFVLKHEGKIDSALNKAQDLAGDAVQGAKDVAADVATNQVFDPYKSE